MDDKQLIPLRESIEHWNRLADGDENESIGPLSCALRREFYIGRTVETACIGCPVHAKTGKKYCAGSPYSDCEDAVKMDGNGKDVFDADFRAKALLQLQFLESLLP